MHTTAGARTAGRILGPDQLLLLLLCVLHAPLNAVYNTTTLVQLQ